jgi:hypothetical protein
MAIPIAASDGHGGTLTFSGLSGNIISIEMSGATREQIDDTHLGSESKTSTPAALVDWGEATAEIDFDYSYIPPIENAKSTLVVVTSNGKTWTCANAFCTSFKPSGIQSGQRMTASVAFKLNTKPVIS